MKLSTYIVRVDSGFAPNPFGGYCTLSCCKPVIRRKAHPGDIVIGTGRTGSKVAGKLIYAMKIDSVLPYQEYWNDPTFHSRKPIQGAEIGRRGDNIWHTDHKGKWQCVAGALHNKSHQKRDVGGKNALIATEFYYFGNDAIDILPRFKKLITSTQGHKNIHDTKIIDDFWRWLFEAAPKKGRIGAPSEFTNEGCRREGA